MDEPYLNREIDEKYKDIDGKLNLLIEQTTKTNGRVTKLEKTVLVILTAVGVLTLSRPDLLAIVLKLIGL